MTQADFTTAATQSPLSEEALLMGRVPLLNLALAFSPLAKYKPTADISTEYFRDKDGKEDNRKVLVISVDNPYTGQRTDYYTRICRYKLLDGGTPKGSVPFVMMQELNGRLFNTAFHVFADTGGAEALNKLAEIIVADIAQDKPGATKYRAYNPPEFSR